MKHFGSKKFFKFLIKWFKFFYIDKISKNVSSKKNRLLGKRYLKKKKNRFRHKVHEKFSVFFSECAKWLVFSNERRFLFLFKKPFFR